MNRHAPFVRDVPGSRGAVLFVHGILGTPRFFDFLLEDIPPDWTVHNVLLYGHGGGVRDFSHASMAAWRAQVAAELSALSADRRVWRYAGWIPRYLELFREIAAVRRMLPDLQTPGVALQSARDEMVSRRALGCLARCPALETGLLEASGHYAYAPEDEARIHQALAALVRA